MPSRIACSSRRPSSPRARGVNSRATSSAQRAPVRRVLRDARGRPRRSGGRTRRWPARGRRSRSPRTRSGTIIDGPKPTPRASAAARGPGDRLPRTPPGSRLELGLARADHLRGARPARRGRAASGGRTRRARLGRVRALMTVRSICPRAAASRQSTSRRCGHDHFAIARAWRDSRGGGQQRPGLRQRRGRRRAARAR